MPQQTVLSQLLFHLALLIVLGNEVLAATVLVGENPARHLLTLVGALVALLARLRYNRLRRGSRPGDTLVDLGGYPLALLRDPRFTRPRRTVV